MTHQRRTDNQTAAALVTLTPREIEVLQLLVQGMSNKAIAKKLFVSDHAIEAHLRRIYRKFYVRNRTSAVVFAICNKVIS